MSDEENDVKFTENKTQYHSMILWSDMLKENLRITMTKTPNIMMKFVK